MQKRFVLGNGENLATNEYFNFLCKIVGKANQYSQLLRLLNRIDFYSLVPNDDNRGADGVHLREMFCDEEGSHYDSSLCPSGPCTMLEMLIGLSMRLEFETAQSKYEKNPGEWFWILIDNLGLLHLDNAAFYHGASIDEVLDKVKVFLEREYTYSGEGGLFPLKYPKNDQRLVEIWYQMSAYVMENYPLW